MPAHTTQAYTRVSHAEFLLGATVIWGLCLSILVPRLLQGQILVMTIDRGATHNGAILVPLGPVSGNITQSVYAAGNIALFASVRYLIRTRSRLTVLHESIIILSALTCLSAVLNLAEHYLKVPSILYWFRTAYSVFETGEARGTGLVRIHGTFSEASAYAAFSIGLFAYNFSLWLDGVRPRVTGGLAFLLLTFLALSTSSTAYGGLIIYGAVIAIGLFHRRLRGQTVPRIAVLFAGGIAVAFLISTLIVAESAIVAKVESFFDATLVNKMDSESGQERSRLNMEALRAFVDSWGLGLGFGSVRASSFIVVLLSNIGAIGTLLYGAFLWRILRPCPAHIPPNQKALALAAAHGVIASICAGALSGTTFERGTLFYVFAALASRAKDGLADQHQDNYEGLLFGPDTDRSRHSQRMPWIAT